MYLSLLGKQNIEFERLKKNTSHVRLRGLINCRGFIYNENENVKDYMKYELDNNLKNIMNKYSCSIDAPLYDNINDEILFVLKINMLGLTKHINLINTKNRNI
jgi:predicted membrane-bound dolichyl-phosphate-mannose-protein mannosyltransferase